MATGEGVGDPRLRADARRNRRRIVDAAIQLVLEVGGEPARDAVASRAGVGIGTLYRHFPDRQDLLRAVVLDVLDRAIQLAGDALADEADGAAALRRYLHGAIDGGLGVVTILHPLVAEPGWPDRTDAAREVLGRLVDRAVGDGGVPVGTTAGDVAMAAIRFCRPLAIGLDPERERQTAHDHLDLHLDGLASRARARPGGHLPHEA